MLKFFVRWFGIFGIVGGEVGNLIAYGYAPAAIVTPIGAVGVLTNVLITTFVLKEKLRKLNILGMFCVVCGIVVAVYFAPRSSDTDFSPNTYWFGFIATMHGMTYFITFAVSAFVMVIVNIIRLTLSKQAASECVTSWYISSKSLALCPHHCSITHLLIH